MKALEQHVPVMITSHLAASERHREAREAFFKEWPQLKSYEKEVMKAGALYRQMNPTADRATAIKAIGTLVAQSLNIAAAAAVTQPATGTTAAAPAAAPFKPAGTHGGSGGPAPAPETNEFTVMANEDVAGRG